MLYDLIVGSDVRREFEVTLSKSRLFIAEARFYKDHVLSTLQIGVFTYSTETICEKYLRSDRRYLFFSNELISSFGLPKLTILFIH
jgi:hypothetical protein